MKFETKVMSVERVENHPNAGRLSIVKVTGYDYKIISAKLDDGSDRYKPADLVVYVQADSIVPENLLRMGFWDEAKGKGILAGKAGNRVKPIKLRGITSEGILFPTQKHYVAGDEVECLVNDTDKEKNLVRFVFEGDDVSEYLGITKYEPEIPAGMSGDVAYIGPHNTLHYDIENAKKFPGVLDSFDGPFYVTEKLHGTFCGIGYLPDSEDDELFKVDGMPGRFIVFSKGLGGKGLVFKNNESNKNNLYVRTVLENNLFKKMVGNEENEVSGLIFEDTKTFVLGEIFGKGVQDLHYGLSKPEFRAFEINIGGAYVGAFQKYRMLEEAGFETVPVLMIVRSEDEIIPFVDGTSTFGGNIREGVVAVPAVEQRHDTLGRVILKYVSEDYLNRKGETTEFQ